MSAIETRQAILERFEAWLDSALQDEAPPAGIDAEILAAAEEDAEPPGDIPPTDDYQLWSALTALTQETKLQSRAFQDLSRIVERQPEALAALTGEIARERERELETRARRESERRCWKEALEILIDLDDRLSRGLESAGAARKTAVPHGLFHRLFGKPDASGAEVTAAVLRGYELALERLAHAFERLNAHPIQCLGETFDPRTMNAVDRQETSEAPEGAVLEVYRGGYEWNGEVLRTAQVKVASAPEEAKNHE